WTAVAAATAFLVLALVPFGYEPPVESGSGTVSCRSGGFTSPIGGVKPPLRQSVPLPGKFFGEPPSPSVVYFAPTRRVIPMNRRGFMSTALGAAAGATSVPF